MKRTIIFICLLLMVFAAQATALNPGKITYMESPSKRLSGAVFCKNGRLLYVVNAGKIHLIDTSVLGLVVNQTAFGSHVTNLVLLNNTKGKDSGVNSFNSYRFLVKEAGTQFLVEFRFSNSGIAFRYIIQGDGDKKVNEELTTFKLPQSRVWYFERDNDWKLQSYAGLWMHTSTDSLLIISKQGPVQGKPLVLELPENKYALLTEAALYNYSGVRFRAIGNRTLKADFTEENGFVVSGKLVTPWRVLIYANSLNALVNNRFIYDLNPEPDKKLYADKKYIKPGKTVWSWITRGQNYMEPKEEMKFIEAAATLNFEYTLLDEGWETKWANKWEQLRDICSFAAKRKVGVWVWENSKNLRDTIKRNLFLDSIHAAGVVGVKTDFMNSEAKDLVDFEIGFLKASAQRKLMVDFHGCQAPTGESKTYPNEMTREGIRGMELNVMKEPIPAWHNAALPFTRLVLGYGDYTPGLFSNKGNTTNTHQFALLYLFNSSFQCLAENPVKLLTDDKFKPIIPMLKRLPVVWDETIVLNGSAIGEMAALARRKGNKWYIAAINGTGERKEITIDPAFLRKRGKYTATIINDEQSSDEFSTKKISIKAGDHKMITMKPNGGLVIEIVASL